MHPADSLKTTFVCLFGKFKFKFERMPFRLCNALAVCVSGSCGESLV